MFRIDCFTPSSQNRCGSHLKILIQAHCPLMFLHCYILQCSCTLYNGRWCYYGFSLLPPPLMEFPDTAPDNTGMTDWITRITIPHLISHHYHTIVLGWPAVDVISVELENSSGIHAIFSFNVHSLCSLIQTTLIADVFQLWIQSGFLPFANL